MIIRTIYAKKAISTNEAYIGERIEDVIARAMSNNEPVGNESPMIYTERNVGVLPEHNVRTDRFDIAIEAMDKVSKTKVARRSMYIKNKKDDDGKSPEGESLQAT